MTSIPPRGGPGMTGSTSSANGAETATGNVTGTTTGTPPALPEKRKASEVSGDSENVNAATPAAAALPNKRSCPHGPTASAQIMMPLTLPVPAQAPAPALSKAALAAKRQAEFYEGKTCSLSDLVHGLIMDSIFSYLDSRALYRLACLTAKSMSEFVTLKHVVYSAVASGGNAQKSMDRIVALLKKEQIHAPSKLRLLRILNGKTCERGADCVQHAHALRKVKEATAAAKTKADRVKAMNNVPKIKGALYVREDFGLFLCEDCTKVCGKTNPKGPTAASAVAKSTPAAKKAPSKQDGAKSAAEEGDAAKYITTKLGEDGTNWFLLHKRVATRQNGYRSSPIILREQFVDSSGEVAGPLLTKTDYLEAKDKGKEVELKKRLKAIDDAALQDGFPSASIITYHKEALEMIEKRKRAAQNQTKKNNAATYNKRLQTFEKKVIKDLKEKLEGEGHAWASVVLSFAPTGNVDKYTRSTPVVKFKCPIVQKIMKDFTVVPSKWDKNKLCDVVIDMRNAFDMIWRSGFHDLSFLDGPANSGDELCKDLKVFYKERLKVTPEVLLLHERMHPDMLPLIQSGKLVEALYRRFEAENTVHVLWRGRSEKGNDDRLVWHTEAWRKRTIPNGQSTIAFFIYSAWCKEQSNLGVVSQNQAIRLFHNSCHGPYRDLGRKNASHFQQQHLPQFQHQWKKEHSNLLKRVHNAIAHANR